MKNKLPSRMLVIATFIFFGFNSNAASLDKDALQAKINGMDEQQKEARMDEIQQRITAIKEMDKSLLTREERKEMRHELKDMRKEVKRIGGGGIYLSLGGILLIILLLIILL